MARFFGLLMGLCLVACASAPPPAPASANLGDAVIVKDKSPLRQAVAIAGVSGGSTSLPFMPPKVSNRELTDAVSYVLASHALLATAAPRYFLTAELVDLKQPFMAVDSLTVTTVIKYTLTDAATGKSLMVDAITKDYTATRSDAYFGNDRTRLANEGSVKASASEFIEKLIAKLDRR